MIGEVSTNCSTRHQCITCMKEYENKSLEELRLEDYRDGKVPSAAAFSFVSSAQPTFLLPPGGTTKNKTENDRFRRRIRQSSSRNLPEPNLSTMNVSLNMLKLSPNSVEASTQTQSEVCTKILKEFPDFVEASTQTQSEFCIEKLSNDLNELMLNGDSSDFTIEVKGVEFLVHKGILSARTPVFQSMFKHKMAERETGRVSIDDCEVDAFRSFVRYIYTGRTDQLHTDTVFGVFTLADKYQVDELKSACLAFIKSTLSVSTFCDVVQFALTYENKELLEQAMDFLSVNTSQVMETVKWMNFLAANHILANELLLKALNRKQQ